MENTSASKKKFLTFVVILGLLFLTATLILFLLKYQSESLLKQAVRLYCRDSIGVELPDDFQMVQRKSLPGNGFYAVIQLQSNTLPALIRQISTNNRWILLPMPKNWVLPEEYNFNGIPFPVNSSNGYYFAESWGLISITNDSFPCYIFSLLDMQKFQLFVISRNPNTKEK
ncbi:MAG: hypothetical protein HPY53_11570 [Brevinematales bacterium]|nr:hypothetical protein [Brevinematales bacterium]